MTNSFEYFMTLKNKGVNMVVIKSSDDFALAFEIDYWLEKALKDFMKVNRNGELTDELKKFHYDVTCGKSIVTFKHFAKAVDVFKVNHGKWYTFEDDVAVHFKGVATGHKINAQGQVVTTTDYDVTTETLKIECKSTNGHFGTESYK